MGLFGKKVDPPPPAPPAAPAFRLECAADIGQGPMPVFPMLMGPAWKPAPGQLARPLIKGPALPDIPNVALVYLIPTPGSPVPSRGYIRQDRVDAIRKTVKDFESEALHNISQRKAAWQVMSSSPAGKVLACTDDYLAAERILDPAFLRLAQAQIGEESLVIGIPARGHLFAAGLSAFTRGAGEARAFATMMEQLCKQAGELGISRWVYTVIGGTINNILEVR